MSDVSFPSFAAVQSLLVDAVQGYNDYQNLQMVVGCVAPSVDGSPYASQIYPIDLSANGNGSGSSLDQNTPFLLGSTSKTYTAVAYTLLCSDFIGFSPDNNGTEGNIDLDGNDLTSVFSAFTALQGRTFRDVVTYTAGLLRYNAQCQGHNPYLLQQFIDDMTNSTPSDVLDSQVSVGQYAYSNLGFALLGLLTDPAYGVFNPVIGTDLQSVMQGLLFGPLGLKNTGFFPKGFDGGGVPAGYTFNAKDNGFDTAKVGNAAFPAYYTGGGILTTGTDLAQWLAFNMGLLTGCTAPWDPSGSDLSYCLPRVYTPELNAPVNNNSCYPCSGWFGRFNGSTPNLFFKDGSLSGASSYMTFVPGSGFNPGGPNGTPGQAGVFVMVNCSTFNLSSGQPLVSFIANQVLGLMQNSAEAGGH